MLLHNMLTSNDDRLLKEIVNDQIKDTKPGCWMEHVKVMCEKYDINIHIINGYKKDNIKQLVKSKINTSVNNEICEASQQKTKLRFIKEYSQKQHISELGVKRCKMMMKIRLNMIETKCNYKGIFKDNLKCEICKLENDTTEHLLKCTSNELMQNNVDKLTKGTSVHRGGLK